MDSQFIDTLAERIKATGAVLQPGGHGLHYVRLRRDNPTLRRTHDVARRCQLVLFMLSGLKEGKERWNCKEFLPYVEPWFETYARDLERPRDAPAALYLVGAMQRIVFEWIGSDPARQALLYDVHHYVASATDRMTKLLGKHAYPLFISGSFGKRVERIDRSAWSAVVDALNGVEAEVVEAAFFMYQMYSNLGIAEPSLDERVPARRQVHGRMVAMFTSTSIGACAACQSARRVAAGLMRSASLNERRAQDEIAVADAVKGLPSCFALAHKNSTPADRARIEVELADDKAAPASNDVERGKLAVARTRLLGAYDLAEAVVDLLLDRTQADDDKSVGFKASDYGYLWSLGKHSGARYRKLEKAGKVPTPDAMLEAQPRPGPTKYRYLKHMAESSAVGDCRTESNRIEKLGRWTTQVAAERCGICHASCQERG